VLSTFLATAVAGDRLSAVNALEILAGRPWRKEQKLACLAAWNALAMKR